MSDPQAQAALAARMAVLGDKFRARTSEQYGDLASLCEKHEPSPSECEAIRRIAHSLAGSAGLFGYHDIARQAANVEDAILQRSPPDVVARELCELCSLLKADVVRAGA
ncbi:Hpt domain-containing protein [Fulvimarina sp. MAC3]|uniref:Hpt domain-containing protein n=1 Tax=Fulvimarina sp. MAC3 TaxID=3148887 RepID=UPI0031FC86EB